MKLVLDSDRSAGTIIKSCFVENLCKMSLRGPEGRGNLLRDEQKKAVVVFEIACPSAHSAALPAPNDDRSPSFDYTQDGFGTGRAGQAFVCSGLKAFSVRNDNLRSDFFYKASIINIVDPLKAESI